MTTISNEKHWVFMAITGWFRKSCSLMTTFAKPALHDIGFVKKMTENHLVIMKEF
jgi:hypothetical protein